MARTKKVKEEDIVKDEVKPVIQKLGELTSVIKKDTRIKRYPDGTERIDY